jgi:hypothetical protein
MRDASVGVKKGIIKLNKIIASYKDELAAKFTMMDHLESDSSVVRRAAGGSNYNDISNRGVSLFLI